MSEDKDKKPEIKIGGSAKLNSLTMADKIPPPKPKKKYFSVNEDEIDQPAGLLGVMLDESGEKDSMKEDVAMYLGSYDEVEVEEALKKYAYSASSTPELVSSCLESLCGIYRRKGKLQEFIDDCKSALDIDGMDDDSIYELEDYISYATKKLES